MKISFTVMKTHQTRVGPDVAQEVHFNSPHNVEGEPGPFKNGGPELGSLHLYITDEALKDALGFEDEVIATIEKVAKASA